MQGLEEAKAAMTRIAVIFYSATGNVRAMAEALAEAQLTPVQRFDCARFATSARRC
jgi:hypothetical protein